MHTSIKTTRNNRHTDTVILNKKIHEVYNHLFKEMLKNNATKSGITC